MVIPRSGFVFRLGITLFSAMLAGGCAAEAVEPAAEETEPPRGQTRADLIFEEAFSEAGRLQVYRDSQGHLGWGLIGGIHDDPETVGRHLSNSVVQMHLSLRPGVAVPSELFDYDKEFVPDSLTPQPERVVDQNKDFAAFQSTVCHDFAVSGGTMRFWRGAYHHSVHSVFSGPNFWLCTSCNDWSFFWNVENWADAEHVLSPPLPIVGEACNRQPPAFAAAPGTWGYHHWWAGYCSGQVGLMSPATANLGVTIHYFVRNPPGAQ